MTSRTKIAVGAATAALLTTTVALAEPNRETSLTPGGNGFAWDGGPLSGAAAFAEVGAAVPCGPGKGCDDTLIRAPERGQLSVKISSEDPNAVDFDLYLFEADENGDPGRQLKSSTSGSSNESVTENVRGGTYLARVVAATGAEGTFTGEAAQATLPPLDLDDDPPDFGPDPAPPGGGTGTGGSGTGGGTGTGGSGGTAQPGTRTTAPATNAAPTSRVRRPGRRSLALAGTAEDPGGKIQYVDVALVRVVSANRCVALTPRGGFRKIRKCTAPPYVRAKGRERWKVEHEADAEAGALRPVLPRDGQPGPAGGRVRVGQPHQLPHRPLALLDASAATRGRVVADRSICRFVRIPYLPRRKFGRH